MSRRCYVNVVKLHGIEIIVLFSLYRSTNKILRYLSLLLLSLDCLIKSYSFLVRIRITLLDVFKTKSALNYEQRSLLYLLCLWITDLLYIFVISVLAKTDMFIAFSWLILFFLILERFISVHLISIIILNWIFIIWNWILLKWNFIQ